MKQVVEFYYKWKKSSRYIPVYSQYCKEFRPNKRFNKSRALLDENQLLSMSSSLQDSDSEVSDTDSLIIKPKDLDLICTFCYSSIQDHYQSRFYQGVKSLFCKDCNLYWMKYGVQRPECEALMKLNKEKGLKRKREKKKTPLVVQETCNKVIVEEKKPKNESCAVCRETCQDQENKLSMCSFCELRVHKLCYGLDDSQYPLFACDKCSNTRHPQSHLVIFLLLYSKQLKLIRIMNVYYVILNLNHICLH